LRGEWASGLFETPQINEEACCCSIFAAAALLALTISGAQVVLWTR
jgi:hypothetical protein